MSKSIVGLMTIFVEPQDDNVFVSSDLQVPCGCAGCKKVLIAALSIRAQQLATDLNTTVAEILTEAAEENSPSVLLH